MSPARRRASRAVEAPTWAKTEVTVPEAASQSAMVSGMRSPSSAGRRITNMPGSAASATSGASYREHVEVGRDHAPFNDLDHVAPLLRPRRCSGRRPRARAAAAPAGARAPPGGRLHPALPRRPRGWRRPRPAGTPGRAVPSSTRRSPSRPMATRPPGSRPRRTRSPGFMRTPSSRPSSPRPSTTALRSMPRWRKAARSGTSVKRPPPGASSAAARERRARQRRHAPSRPVAALGEAGHVGADRRQDRLRVRRR